MQVSSVNARLISLRYDHLFHESSYLYLVIIYILFHSDKQWLHLFVKNHKFLNICVCVCVCVCNTKIVVRVLRPVSVIRYIPANHNKNSNKLTSCSRVLLEKLAVFRLAKKCSTF